VRVPRVLLDGPHGHARVRDLFLAALGAVYLCAFASLWAQIHGLIGSGGIAPITTTLERIAAYHGDRAVLRFPTLLWLGSSDGALHLLCGGGVALSVLVVLGFARLPCLVLLWAFYLSLFRAGLMFLSFQWDTLLLECGFLAFFLAPWGWRSGTARRRPVSLLALWAQRWLLFRLMFASGVVKLMSGDPSWRDGSALGFHYETQPLPTPVAWLAHRLPDGVQRVCVIGMLLIEIGLPLLVFAGRRGRQVAFLGFVALQLAIALTGNYGFFNLLTIVLCLTLLDDGALPWRARRASTEAVADAGAAAVRGVWPRRVALGLMLLLATSEFFRGIDLEVPWPRPVAEAGQAIDALRLTSSYGLFRVMTRTRPELVVEGSRDGVEWTAYPFRFKPGDVTRAPGFLAPHMPRLDWQMWFAALSRYERQPWLEPFLDRLLENAPSVVGLLESNPFADEPPRYVRVIRYRYEFTSADERRETGAWWRRTKLGLYSPVLWRE